MGIISKWDKYKNKESIKWTIKDIINFKKRKNIKIIITKINRCVQITSIIIKIIMSIIIQEIGIISLELQENSIINVKISRTNLNLCHIIKIKNINQYQIIIIK
jgi:hypothetical protein